jgi:hypothetical protein
MKKILTLAFIILYLSSICFAGLAEKKSELSKVKKYIRSLDAKIIAARSSKKINKIAQLKDLKRRQLERAKLIKVEIAELEKGGKKPVAKPVVKKEAKARAGVKAKVGAIGWQVEAGYGGGALIVGGGYAFPFRNLNLVANATLGMGNGYNIMNARLKALFNVRGQTVGTELGISNYSETVTDIPLVSGDIDKGAKLGFGVFWRRPINLPRIGKAFARVGYNTALGLNAGIVYKF